MPSGGSVIDQKVTIFFSLCIVKGTDNFLVTGGFQPVRKIPAQQVDHRVEPVDTLDHVHQEFLPQVPTSEMRQLVGQDKPGIAVWQVF